MLARYVHVPERGYGLLEETALRRASIPRAAVVLGLLGVALVACTAVAVRELLSRTTPT